MEDRSQCSLSWSHWHPYRQRYAHHDSLLLSYFCPSASTPNWPLSLHCHAKNTPLIGLAPDHMDSNPLPTHPVSATRDPGRGMPIHEQKSRFFLYCSYTQHIPHILRYIAAGGVWVLYHFLQAPPSPLEFVYATSWYRKRWVIATTAQLKEDWIRVLF